MCSVYNLSFIWYRLYNKKRPYDPIDIDCIKKIDSLVVEDERQDELDYDKLEEMLYNEQATNLVMSLELVCNI